MLWPTKKLEEVCSRLTDGSHFSPRTIGQGKPYITVRDVDWNGNIGFDFCKSITEANYENLVKTGCKPNKGDILFSKDGTVGKVALVQTDREFVVLSSLAIVTPNKLMVNPEYLYWVLKGPVFQQVSIQEKTGAAIRRIVLKKLKKIEIPLPPIEIQKKIVKKIEELFEKIDQAQIFRESASTDASKLVTVALEQFLHTNSSVKDLTISELANDLQAGFACGKQNEVNDGVIHLRTHNIELNGELNLDKIVRIPDSMVNKSAYGLKKGDLLFNNTNSTELVGKTIIIRQDLPYAFSNHINRIRFNTSLVIPEWVLYIFQKYWRDKYFEHICTRWVGQSGVNQSRLAEIKIPIPPIAKQKKIVARLDALTEKVRELQKLQKETAEDLKALKESILHKAFQGELL